MKYKIVLFDADGTLYDFDKASVEALKSNFIYNNIKWSEERFVIYNEVNKKIWTEFEQGLITTNEIKTERFKRFFDIIGVTSINSIKFSSDYLKYLSENNFLLPNAEDIVKWSSEKFDLAIVTNGIAVVQNSRLKNSLIRKYFKHIVISEEIGFAKPGKEIFEFTLNLFPKVAKDEVIIIGDNLTSDIKGGNLFGIDTCWINPNETNNSTDINPTFQIKELLELKEILY